MYILLINHYSVSYPPRVERQRVKSEVVTGV